MPLTRQAYIKIAFKLALSEIGGRAYTKIHYKVSPINNFSNLGMANYISHLILL